MPNDIVLRCSALTKSFAGVTVLKGVSLYVAQGETVCIAGENGAGKSTLMNLIGGVHQPDSGTMEVAGQPYRPAGPLDAVAAGIAFVHQELNLFPNLSLAENILLTDYPHRPMLGMRLLDHARAARETQPLLERVGLQRSPDTPVEDLSQGDRQLVEIARALHADARLIIFDEPTTSLTEPEVERLMTILADLRQRGIAVLYISHALEHVLRLADRIVVMRDGAVVAEDGGKQFSVDSLVQAMVGRSIDQLYPRRASSPGREVVLKVEGVSQPGVAEKVSFDLHAGEILGIAGLMGSGRSELARILFGLDPAARGTVTLAGEPLNGLSPRERIRRGLAFLTESRRDDGLFLDASIEENLRIVHPQAEGGESLIRELRVSCKDMRSQAVVELSGGNQQKVALAKWLLEPPRMLILDEPTRGIDIGAKQDLYRLIVQLADRGIPLLIISSEVEELVGLCDRVLVMARGELRGEFPAGSTREQ
ncbi:MAG TPA: sugar ABC transporter ATP-binding protein, partial [Bryobacteraceae bacterium]|nr:sugar ABC transporter ATP-binding protein [Bryobacteraceae bacterium]